MNQPTPTPSFRRFGESTKKPAEAAAEVKQAEVIKDTPTTPKVEQKNALSVFGKPSGANALSAFLAVSDEKPQFDLFPVVGVTGGNNGGQFDAAKHMSAELKALLPSGRKPIRLVVLAYRVALIAFPAGKTDDSENAKPVWSAVIPSHEGDAMTFATKLTKKYQYTRRDQRPKYDHATSGCGHVKPTLCLLCYLVDQNMLVEIRTPNHYNSVERTSQELAAHFNAEGALEPFPCELKTVSTAEGKDKANPWVIHHLAFDNVTNDKKTEMKVKFDAWIAAATDDAELTGNYNKWITGTDRSLTDEHMQAIQKGLAL